MKENDVVIVSAKRTPLGSFGGTLATVSAPILGSIVIQAVLADSGVSINLVDSVTLGCVLTAGLRQAPTRQAAIAAGLPISVPCTTVNKVCGSSLQAIIYGCHELIATSSHCVIVGGMESMSQAPYLLPTTRFGQRLGHGKIQDHIFYDGLENAYGDHGLMGFFADATSAKYGFSRKNLDDFAIESTRRARDAQQKGYFNATITPVEINTSPEKRMIDQDEGPEKAKPEKIPTLKPAFSKDGVTTAANSSSISDGAAALILMTAKAAKEQGLKPLAKILGYAGYAQEPEWFTTAPIGAITRLLKQLNWTSADVDCYEINEAFAVVTLASIRELKLDPNKVNTFGGAVALGHPIGATGARLLVTLLNQLQQKNLNTGIASACIGGGEALAIAIERLT
jgi:acetyl-CoA C-acetyltransferase